MEQAVRRLSRAGLFRLRSGIYHADMDDADVPFGNVLFFAAVALLPTVAFWLLLRVPRVADWLGRRRRREPLPSGPPVELLAADLRRVRGSFATLAADAPAVRRLATGQAYDALLAQACTTVGIEHELDAVPQHGVERELERLRVEEALRGAGLTI